MEEIPGSAKIKSYKDRDVHDPGTEYRELREEKIACSLYNHL